MAGRPGGGAIGPPTSPQSVSGGRSARHWEAHPPIGEAGRVRVGRWRAGWGEDKRGLILSESFFRHFHFPFVAINEDIMVTGYMMILLSSALTGLLLGREDTNLFSYT